MKTLAIAVYLLSAVSASTADFSTMVVKTFYGLQQSKDITIDGMGVKKEVKMNGGTLSVQGANCDIRVNGFADRIEVEGANVTVHADAVNTVKIEGANSFVYYRSTRNKNGKIASSVFGMNSSVKKIK